MTRSRDSSERITRIAYNTADWRQPMGEARKYEGRTTYNHKFGFGHEEWLFRSEWSIGGWRYSFLQGVNKSHSKLMRSPRPFDVALYAIDNKKRRRTVAFIRDVECLSATQAKEALGLFKRLGWYAKMVKEIEAINGDPTGLGAQDWAPLILNIRFRVENIVRFRDGTFLPATTPGLKRGRYQLNALPKNIDWTALLEEGTPSNGKSILEANTIVRRPIGPVTVTPEHRKMQAKLVDCLRAEYPKADIQPEVGFVDVRLEARDEVVFFEIKSDLDPRVVIRNALGQILEYAYHRTHDRPPTKLVIVGRQGLTPADQRYFDRLRNEFHLPIAYRVLSID